MARNGKSKRKATEPGCASSRGPKNPAEVVPAIEAGFPLLQHLDELVDGLRTDVPDALRTWDEEAIHDARVATRRLKAALDLLRPVLTPGPRKSFGRTLRRLRRRLGPLRDQDVMLGHLKDLEADARLKPAAARWVAAATTEQRERAREQTRRAVSVTRTMSRLGRWWGVREEVCEAHEAVSTLLRESVHLQLDAFVEQADLLVTHAARQRAVAAAAASESPAAPGAVVSRAGDPPPAQAQVQGAASGGNGAATASTAAPAPSSPVTDAQVDPHELRIAGKALRYTLEMAAKERVPLPAGVAKTFKQMQECLGLWHDFVVLSDRVLATAVERMLSHHDPALMEHVLDLARAALRKSAKELDRFVKLWCDRGESMSRQIRAAFPLTPAVAAAAAAAATERPDDAPAGAATSPCRTVVAERADAAARTEPAAATESAEKR